LHRLPINIARLRINIAKLRINIAPALTTHTKYDIIPLVLTLRTAERKKALEGFPYRAFSNAPSLLSAKTAYIKKE
jgi:hypothetical protein